MLDSVEISFVISWLGGDRHCERIAKFFSELGHTPNEDAIWGDTQYSVVLSQEDYNKFLKFAKI